jgi:branched-chain amino acid transport system substrate-binding protein
MSRYLHTRLLLAVACVLALSLVWTGCAQPEAPAQPAAPAEQAAPTAAETGGEMAPAGPEEIVIGAALPLTGEESKIGNYFQAAYQLAVDEINAAGGVSLSEYGTQVPIRLDIKDDQSDKAQTVSLVERLITRDEVDLLLGGYSTTLVQAQAPVADKYQMPYINGGGAATNIYAQGFECVYGTLSPIEVLAQTEMDWLKSLIDAGELPKPLSIAMLWENTSHGEDYVAGVEQRTEANPGYFEILLNEPFELHGSDFSSVLDKVAGVDADVFLVDAHLPDYITMHRQYTQKGLEHLMVTYGARGPDAAAREALGDATNGIFAAVWWSPDLPYPQVQQFNEKWQAAQPDKPLEWYAAVPYDTVRVLVDAVETVGSLDKEGICQALADTELDDSLLPGQKLSFTETGQTNAPFVVVQNKPNNEAVIVYPEDAKTGEPTVPMNQAQ